MVEVNVPKGNRWVARTLRLLNENSNELFPKTPAESKASKFDSMYKVDYHNFPTEVLLEGLKPKGQQLERETIRDVLFGQSPTSRANPVTARAGSHENTAHENHVHSHNTQRQVRMADWLKRSRDGQQLERETIRDVLFGQSPTSM